MAEPPLPGRDQGSQQTQGCSREAKECAILFAHHHRPGWPDKVTILCKPYTVGAQNPNSEEQTPFKIGTF